MSLLAMAAAKGMVDSTIVALGGLIGLLTIAASAYLVQYSELLYEKARAWKLLSLIKVRRKADPEVLLNCVGHIVVIGMNTLGREIVRRLTDRGENVLAIDTDPEKLRGLEPAGTLIGNIEYQSVIEEIGLRRAQLVISALQIESVNQLLAYRCRSLNVPCVIHAFNVSVVDDLFDLKTAYLLMPSVDGVTEQHRLMEAEGLL